MLDRGSGPGRAVAAARGPCGAGLGRRSRPGANHRASPLAAPPTQRWKTQRWKTRSASPALDGPLGDDNLPADEPVAAPALEVAELAGQMRIPPGASLAAWLGQAEPTTLDDAGLVNSIAGWRKVTSWAQAQELAAVAEVARRRGVADDPSLDRDPARELEAEFVPNEIALALTMTQFAAEYWVSLAVACPAGFLHVIRAALGTDRPQPGQADRPVHHPTRR